MRVIRITIPIAEFGDAANKATPALNSEGELRMTIAPQAGLITALSALILANNPAHAVTGDNAQIERLLAQLTAQQAQLEQQRLELDQQRNELLELKAVLLSTRAVPSAPVTASSVATPGTADGGNVERKTEGLELSGYGVVSYFNRDWETDEFAKDALDTERFILELEYRFDEKFFAKAELEFEHGGTGATMEFDSQEEFGEFEQSIEKGGEVIVEELFVAYQHDDWLNARIGRFYVPVGRTSRYHKPQQYFTVARSEADGAMIPQLWHEAGISVYGSWALDKWGSFNYETQIVTGLDSTGFSSRNWVAGGHQKRFEQAVAEDLAFVARLDYFPQQSLQIGAAYYGGNSVGNRPKDDLEEDAFVDILAFDGQWLPGDFILRGQYMWGRLQNSHLVTDANRNLSNNLGVKRTPVGSEAQSWYVEAGYDLLRDSAQTLILFGRYEAYDSMYRTEGLVFDNPRWDRESWTVGINYLPIPSIIIKAEYNQRSVDLDDNNEDNTFALGVGFTY